MWEPNLHSWGMDHASWVSDHIDCTSTEYLIRLSIKSKPTANRKSPQHEVVFLLERANRAHWEWMTCPVRWWRTGPPGRRCVKPRMTPIRVRVSRISKTTNNVRTARRNSEFFSRCTPGLRVRRKTKSESYSRILYGLWRYVWWIMYCEDNFPTAVTAKSVLRIGQSFCIGISM